MRLALFPTPPDPTAKRPVRIWSRVAGALLLGWLTGCAQTPTEMATDAHIRFYNINGVGQLSE